MQVGKRLLVVVMTVVIAAGLLAGEAQAARGRGGGTVRKSKPHEATKVLSVDCSANTITTKHGNDVSTYSVDNFTTIIINGQKGDLTGIKPGMEVIVNASSGGKKASRIDAEGSGSEPEKTETKKKKK